MLSIGIKRFSIALLWVCCTTAAATGSDKPPSFLTIPLLGLRVPLNPMNLEPFPEELRATCSQIEDNEVHTAYVWITGKASDATSTYYVLTGYFKRRHPEPGQRLYEVWDNGAIFTIREGVCGGDDAVETFEVHDPTAATDGNVPEPMLQALAQDLASRTVRAMGGPRRLSNEISRQGIDVSSLPQELQTALSRYLAK